MRFLADENLDGRILRGLRRHVDGIDVVTVVELGFEGMPDPELLVLADSLSRVLLTHDKKTMDKHVKAHIDAGLSIPGVVSIPRNLSFGTILEDIDTIAGASHADELRDRVEHLPL